MSDSVTCHRCLDGDVPEWREITQQWVHWPTPDGGIGLIECRDKRSGRPTEAGMSEYRRLALQISSPRLGLVEVEQILASFALEQRRKVLEGMIQKFESMYRKIPDGDDLYLRYYNQGLTDAAVELRKAMEKL